jgi:hypothetical protein
VWAYGSNIGKLVNASERDLEVFSGFSRSILEGNFEDSESYVRYSSGLNLTDTEKRVQLSKFMRTWREKLSKFDDEEGVVISVTSTGESSFNVSFRVASSRVLNASKNRDSPVAESEGGEVLSNVQIAGSEGFDLLQMEFRRDSVGWYFHSGSATSVK